MGKLGFKFLNTPDNVTQRGALSHYVKKVIRFAMTGYTCNPRFSEGYYSPGRPTSIQHNVGVTDIEVVSGSPKYHMISLPSESKLSIVVTIDHFNDFGLRLSSGNDLASTYTLKTDGSPITVTSADKFTATLSDASLMKPDHMLLFDNTSDLTYGGMKQMAILTEVLAGNIVKYAQISQAPIATTTVRRVAGLEDLDAAPTAGMITPIAPGGVRHPVFQCAIDNYLTNNRGIITEYYPEVQVIPSGMPDFGDGSNLATLPFTLAPIAQEANWSIDFTQPGAASTRDLAIYGYYFWMPNRS